MKIFKDIFEWKKYRQTLPRQKSLGVVMTMGALHAGHFSLIEESKSNNDYTLATIFLNPTQFNNTEDLNRYPKTWQQDIEALEKLNVEFLLAPVYEQVYSDNYRYNISENNFSKILCGKSRPGHFDGVLTVVMKLLQLAKADRAYFGEKDYQQYHLIKGMAEAFFLETDIISCKIVREKDGLAMSSRNLRLTDQGRKLASLYANLIRENLPINTIKNKLECNNITVVYLEEHFGRRFTAVMIEDIRLIDNFDLEEIKS
jgi:pantoate--beta-alanine ligase